MTDASVTVGGNSLSLSSSSVLAFGGVPYTTIANIRTLMGGNSVFAVSYDSVASIVRLKHR